MGGYIAEYLDWRWVEWVTLIISGAVLMLVFFLQPETYPPVSHAQTDVLSREQLRLRDAGGGLCCS